MSEFEAEIAGPHADSTAGLTTEERALVAEEEAILATVQETLRRHLSQRRGAEADFDAELLALRDQISTSRAEDHAAIVDEMGRIAALREAQARQGPSLVALPDNPYFGRLRLRDEVRGQTRHREILIGRRPFLEPRSEAQVVDWRNSPISRIYYCYAEGDEYEEVFAGAPRRGFVERRRTVTIHDGQLMRLRAGDVQLARDAEGRWHRLSGAGSDLAGGQGAALRPPAEQLGRTRRDGHLPEITALIDAEQFRAITAERSGVVVIRGGAGTGKTTIALHRIAWLHFADPERFNGRRVLAITPGDALRRYISRVLPALDVSGVPIHTFAQWAIETARRLLPAARERRLTEHTPFGASRLKRHPFLLDHLERWVEAEARALEPMLREAGGEALLEAWVRRRTLPVMRRLDAVERWARGPGEPEVGGRSRAVAKALAEARAAVGDPFDTWADALTDRPRLTASLRGVPHTGSELEQLIRTVTLQAEEPLDVEDLDPDRRTGVDGRAVDDGDLRAHLDVDDLAILLHICQLKYGRLTAGGRHTVSYEHVMVDEAQDLPPLYIKLLCGLAPPGGPVTLAGDTAQRLTLDAGFEDWETLIATLRLRANVLPPLAISYRSTAQVMALARHVLGPLASVETPRDVREGAPVTLHRFDADGEAVAFLADALKSLHARERRATIALVARTPAVADLYYSGLHRAEVPNLRRVLDQEFEFTAGVDVTDLYQIKGLEYDYVVLLETTVEHFPLTLEARHLLHIGATRAAHQLWLVTTATPSPLLPADLSAPLASNAPSEAR